MNELPNKDKEFFLLERTAFRKALLELGNKKIPKLYIIEVLSISIAFWIAILTTENFPSVLSFPSNEIKLIVSILACILTLLFVILLIIKFYHKRQGKSELTVSLVENVLEKYSEELSVYDVLLIIPDFIKKDKLYFLAKKHMQWQNAIFLPYIHYDSKEKWDRLDELNEKISEQIKTKIKFKYEYLSEMDICNDVKYHRDEGLRRHNYKFILLYPRSNFLINIFLDDIKRDNYAFFDIEDMQKDVVSMKRNSEVIDKLMAKDHYLQQKINILNRNVNRIIWNISKQCDEPCEFCAFGNSAKENHLSPAKIEQLIEKLSTIKLDIISISTGDKIDINYLKKNIVELKKAGYKVHLTATAKVINLLDLEFISKNISMIEFTYDSSGSNSHRSKKYNEANYLCIENLSKGLEKNKITLKALIILYLHLTPKMFENIINKLIKINVHNVTLIRTMPVGLMSNRNYPEELMVKKTYENYLSFKTKNKMNIAPHCSLDGLVNKCIKYCNRGITKLSMNPSGDIYDCPWGEHLSEGNNIFHLGNIFESDIINMINEQDFKNMESEKFICEIFNVSRNKDFLYE